MKDLIVKIALALVFALAGILGISTMCYAQDYQRNGNNFVQTSTRGSSNTTTKTEYTWTDSKGNKYPIFVTKTGRCFVNKVSGKTGREYKFYLKEEIARQICKEMNIQYQEKK